MKKLLAVLLMLAIVQASAMAIDGTLYYMDVPLGANRETAYDILQNKGASMSGLDYHYESEDMFRDLIAPERYSSSDYNDYRLVADEHISMDGLSVAGYKVYWAEMNYVATLEDGVLKYDDAHSVFYAGQYLIHAQDANAAFDDLLDKLTQKYGECTWSGEDIETYYGRRNLYSSNAPKERYAIWDAEDSDYILALTCLDQQEGSNYEDTIIIVYGWKPGELMMANGYPTAIADRQKEIEKEKQKKLEEEQAIYGNGDTSGL